MEIIEKYRDNPHVSRIVVNESNSGSTFKQWKKGIDLAKGDLIWIAESDDFCELTFLEELVKAFLRKSNTVIAYSKVLIVDEDGVPSRPILPCNPKSLFSSGGFSFRNLKEHLKSIHRHFKYGNRYVSGHDFLKRYQLVTSAVTNASGAIFSREAALKLTDQYIKAPAAGDYFFWTELAYFGNVAIVNRPLAYWRFHSGNVTSANNANGLNVLANKQIFDSIVNNLNLSSLRRRMGRACQIHFVESVHYASDVIERKCKNVWEVERYNKFVDRLLYRLHSKAVRYYNVYL